MRNTGIVILNYNNYEDTINCIESCEKYNTAPIKYIIIDNASTRKDTVANLRQYLEAKFEARFCFLKDTSEPPADLPYCTFLASDTNDGYACGNKKGLALAYLDEGVHNILILNNDVLFIEDFIPTLSDHLWKTEECMLATPMVLDHTLKKNDTGCARISKSYGYMLSFFLFRAWDPLGIQKKKRKSIQMLTEAPSYYKQDMEIDMPVGACFMVKADDFKAIGDFDPNTFLYFEEDIIASKIKKIGKKSILVPVVRCVHLGAKSTGKTSSVFLLDKELESARYYVKNYMNIGRLKFVLFWIISEISKYECLLIHYLKK